VSSGTKLASDWNATTLPSALNDGFKLASERPLSAPSERTLARTVECVTLSWTNSEIAVAVAGDQVVGEGVKCHETGVRGDRRAKAPVIALRAGAVHADSFERPAVPIQHEHVEAVVGVAGHQPVVPGVERDESGHRR
jgi:hypothetical protein